MLDAGTAHWGTVLKARGEGDSICSVFTQATDGLAAALSAQRALLNEAWPESTPLSVRMALHTGEAFERAGDYDGPAVGLRGSASEPGRRRRVRVAGQARYPTIYLNRQHWSTSLRAVGLI
jgi:class 3 adenylate cyclase